MADARAATGIAQWAAGRASVKPAVDEGGPLAWLRVNRARSFTLPGARPG